MACHRHYLTALQSSIAESTYSGASEAVVVDTHRLPAVPHFGSRCHGALRMVVESFCVRWTFGHIGRETFYRTQRIPGSGTHKTLEVFLIWVIRIVVVFGVRILSQGDKLNPILVSLDFKRLHGELPVALPATPSQTQLDVKPDFSDQAKGRIGRQYR
ncbi:hypothetical protein R3I93_010738 [Phoxinus phoxinus]|uniref:Uncharacterized protein n=1 Tax=Phoxinus phoxinus TaxID=58324 RepID=A0AAN9H3N3_9TELE